MSTPIENSFLLGKHVPWKSIEKEACRVNHFTAVARIEAGKVQTAVKGMPYALLRVESPFLSGETIMPVVHRLDSLNSWEVFEQRGVGEEEEQQDFAPDSPRGNAVGKKSANRGLERYFERNLATKERGW